ncbi:MAG TPA: zf-HC2 domain-containing protein [Vicinamibacterales bacterium]|nr:zf-HC2 domain-containing protein [Vicinamibacterales bacterium]
MMMNADCRHTRELMDSYISGELTVESNHELLQHVERCDACRGELARRERTRALLVDSFGVPPDASGIETRITRAIDQHERKWWRFARYGSVAAVLALAIGSAIWFSRPVDAAAFDDSVDDHIMCALAYPPGVTYSADRARSNLQPRYHAIVNAVTHQSGDYQLIDAHMCPYEGRDYAHLVYNGPGKPVSVFVEQASRGRLPLRHESPRRGHVSLGRSVAGHQVFVVTDHQTPAPFHVIEELMRSTIAFVRGLEP